jgi:membrane carboxypeptidase/penicillin-binding protein PbpC
MKIAFFLLQASSGTVGAEANNLVPLAVTMPADKASFLLDPLVPDESEHIILEARASLGVQTVEWLVDGKKIGTALAPDFRMKWKPVPGNHEISVTNGSQTSRVRIEILKNR